LLLSSVENDVMLCVVPQIRDTTMLQLSLRSSYAFLQPPSSTLGYNI
jgi:hypothetical protein